jgi:hypothetical protein
MLQPLGCDRADPVEEAQRYIRAGRAHAAIERLEPVVREQPENYDAHFSFGSSPRTTMPTSSTALP